MNRFAVSSEYLHFEVGIVGGESSRPPLLDGLGGCCRPLVWVRLDVLLVRTVSIGQEPNLKSLDLGHFLGNSAL